MEQRIAGRAFIQFNNKILIIRESQSYQGGSHKGKYDLPGGKIDDESFNDGLKREVREECGLEVEVGRPFYITEWVPTAVAKAIRIYGIFVLCTAISDEVKLGPAHDDYQWIAPQDISKYPTTEATAEAFAAYGQFPQ